MSNEKSCVGCAFLYTHGSGYSNYTWENTYVLCAFDSNPSLVSGVEEPYDWNKEDDNWPATQNSRCEKYHPAQRMITLDVDGEDFPDDYTDDILAIWAVEQHSGRKRGER